MSRDIVTLRFFDHKIQKPKPVKIYQRVHLRAGPQKRLPLIP